MTKSKDAQFQGKIISSLHDYQSPWSGVTGPHQVLYPKDEGDVACAVTHALSENQKTFIRSGIQSTQDDTVDGTDGIVINLKHLSDVSINGYEVKAQAGATIDVVFEQLAKNNPALVLPLADNPLKSITSNVLYEDEISSCLKRSLGPLSGYVSTINAVKPDGNPVIFQGISSIAQCKDSKAVVTQVTFKAVSAENLCMVYVNILYPGQDHLTEIAKSLFKESTRSSKMLEKTDVMMDAYTDRHGVPLLRITAIRYSNDGRNDPKDLNTLINESLTCLPLEDQKNISFETCSGSKVLDALLGASIMGVSLDPTINSKKIYSVINMNEDLISYAEKVNGALSFGDTSKDTPYDKEVLSYRLQINSGNDLELTGYVYTPKPTIENSPTAIERAAPLHTVVLSARSIGGSKGPIENFSGPIYQQGDKGYDEKIKQYATTSYPQEKMTPLMVAYPINVNDIIAAIEFSKKQNKHIVARSGGHQYTGKSSGGQDTIVLSMDNFNTLKQLEGDLVEVGPGVKLTVLADQFNKWGITIPHGECPLVAIGGHAQTGGYGHLVRSFGLALDYVQAFDIVLANGTSRHITRPDPKVLPTTDDQKLDQEIFRGVLGGNAGSFGIITRYIFNGIKNTDHPCSYGFKLTRVYDKQVFGELMNTVQEWTKKIENHEDDTLRGLDFMMTVESSSGTLLPSLLLVELVYSDLDKGTPYNEQFKPIIDIANKNKSILEKLGQYFLLTEGQKTLSALSDSFVRRFPATINGREFRYPYKKRINCTTKSLTNDFIKNFVEKIDEVVTKESGVKLVVQMLLGGGAYRDKGNDKVGDITTTSIPHRNYVYCFVFDLFYEPGEEQRAIELQEEMQHIVDTTFNNGQEMRVFWGTFGDTNISDPTIRKMYYDDEIQYAKLQKLKQRVDPTDVFHTELTVQLPQGSS